MFNPLVVYYSRTGTTRNVADALVHETGWDCDPIVDPTFRAGLFGYLRSGFDAIAHRPVPLEPPRLDPSPYPLIVIGTPIWNASVSAPVRTYLIQHARSLPAVAFFATCGGQGSRRAFAQMAELAGKPPVATLALTERQIARAEHLPLLRRFIEELQHTAPPRRPRPEQVEPLHVH